ncbi:MAG: hypothetical protein FJ215_03005 [Ignavibacteria bacterium]|nr:hypothetical protein [Ignavibacteria bacterium]
MNSSPSIVVVVSLIVSFLAGCERSTQPDEYEVVAYQIKGCRQQLGKRGEGDSCFAYVFRESLVVDFCVTGNCCPDTNRFIITPSIALDTIEVTVVDTAQNLCRCVCPYLLHVEIHNLRGNSYFLRCIQLRDSVRVLLYSRRVVRDVGWLGS